MAYSNFTVAHAWAHNLDKCHNGSSLYHDGGILKSYNTCIAQRIELNGKVAYILNNHHFSSSTCKHQSAAYHAVPVGALKFIIDMENWGASSIVGTCGWWHSEEAAKESRMRFGMRYIISELYTCLDMKTSRKFQSNFTRHGYDDLKRWLEFTEDTTIPKLLRMSDEELLKYIHNGDFYELRKYSHRKIDDVSKMVRKFLRMLHENKGTEEICDAINGKGTYAEWDKYQQRILKGKRTYQQNAAIHRQNAELREKKEREARTFVQQVIMERGDEGRRWLWHEGYNVSLYFTSLSLFYGGNVLLRVKGNIVETSKGIKITKNECKRLWSIISRWHNNATEFVAGENVKATLSNFTISRYQNDIMIAGCHAIAYCEMESVARQLGFI